MDEIFPAAILGWIAYFAYLAWTEGQVYMVSSINLDRPPRRSIIGAILTGILMAIPFIGFFFILPSRTPKKVRKAFLYYVVFLVVIIITHLPS